MSGCMAPALAHTFTDRSCDVVACPSQAMRQPLAAKCPRNTGPLDGNPGPPPPPDRATQAKAAHRLEARLSNCESDHHYSPEVEGDENPRHRKWRLRESHLLLCGQTDRHACDRSSESLPRPPHAGQGKGGRAAQALPPCVAGIREHTAHQPRRAPSERLDQRPEFGFTTVRCPNGAAHQPRRQATEDLKAADLDSLGISQDVVAASQRLIGGGRGVNVGRRERHQAMEALMAGPAGAVATGAFPAPACNRRHARILDNHLRLDEVASPERVREEVEDLQVGKQAMVTDL
mmetsp:Transcript_28500/g.82514  ORF Transcript_28500/g.82514 Transcript_28500/m.82514 type:complete len:290 (+) Transcript_28500:88-957(+)